MRSGEREGELMQCGGGALPKGGTGTRLDLSKRSREARVRGHNIMVIPVKL